MVGRTETTQATSAHATVSRSSIRNYATLESSSRLLNSGLCRSLNGSIIRLKQIAGVLICTGSKGGGGAGVA